MPEPETAALNLTCAECGRSPKRGEVWSIYYADIGEAVTYLLTPDPGSFPLAGMKLRYETDLRAGVSYLRDLAEKADTVFLRRGFDTEKWAVEDGDA